MCLIIVKRIYFEFRASDIRQIVEIIRDRFVAVSLRIEPRARKLSRFYFLQEMILFICNYVNAFVLLFAISLQVICFHFSVDNWVEV